VVKTDSAGREHSVDPAASVSGFIATLVALGVLLAGSLVYYLPGSVFGEWVAEQSGAYGKVWPQGWSFFDSEPGSWTVQVYAVDQRGELEGPLIQPLMSAAGSWGLGRQSVVQFYDAGLLASRVPAADWRTCKSPVSSRCLEGASPLTIANISEPAPLCGAMALVEISPGGTATGAGSRDGTKLLVTEVRIRCA
jgi:hypothetical protein